MNKTLKYALGAVLTAGMVMPVFAQDNFPDVPDNHWAYEALARMKKDGLLVGYPDGLYRGNRPASRYELAVAVHATYTHLKNITDGLQAQIDDLKAHAPGPANLDDIRNALQQLQNDVNNMKGWGADIDNLKKMAATFEKELASMGVDIEGLKKDLADLAKRVGVLEAHRLPIDVHGDANIFMMAGGSSSHRPGITVDGRPVGVADKIFAGPTFAPVGMSQDLNIFHELGLRISGNNETGPKWHATLVAGNMLGLNPLDVVGQSAGPFPSQSSTNAGAPFTEGPTSVYFQDFAVSFDTSILNQGFSAELGRTGYSIDPYIFQRPDVTPYFQNERWDNGKWMFDGGIFGFHFGGAKFDIFGGRNSNRRTTNNIDLDPMVAGAVGHRYTTGGPRPIGLANNNPAMGPVTGVPIDQSLGLNLNVPLGQNGKIDLAYIWLESNTGVDAAGNLPDNVIPGLPAGGPRVANRVNVFGGDLKWNFGAIVFDGGYSQSNVYNGKANVVNRDNFAWHAQAAYDSSRWGVQVGYREIQPQFGAPGDWGRIGVWWNPTDIRGPEASVHLNLTDQLKLTAMGEWYNGVGKTITLPAAFGGGTSTGLGTNDRINRYTAELGYRLNDAWNISLGIESVDWDLKSRAAGSPGGPFTGGKPRERWYNVGLGYNLSDMAKLSFLYQYSDYNSNGIAGFSPFRNETAGNEKATGSLLTTQLTIKF